MFDIFEEIERLIQVFQESDEEVKKNKKTRRRATDGRARRDLVDVGIRCDSRSIAMRMPTPAKLVARAMGGKQSKRRERTIAIVCTSADSSACDATRRDDDDD